MKWRSGCRPRTGTASFWPSATVDGPDRSVCRQSPAASVKGMRQPPTIRGTKAAAGSSRWASPKRSSISVTGRCTKWPCSPRSIIGEYYGQAPSLSYYNGCSTGGRQGLMEAQRYPLDFDGMIVGAPVNNVNNLHAAQTQKFMEIMGDESRYIPPEKVQMIADAVMNACDSNDGAVDGLINNPEMCSVRCRVSGLHGGRNRHVPHPRTGRLIGARVLPGVHLRRPVRISRARIRLRTGMENARTGQFAIHPPHRQLSLPGAPGSELGLADVRSRHGSGPGDGKRRDTWNRPIPT